ncbi:MAG TPA: NAD(P)-dependent oxidoreductase [Solirubrobacteraceae bacterium]|jgi:3-hydroxyisobutyrate dehydrogenase|nr:NAD(P)-dependent oxidoreductase [Solirubrobacteraceae bacterium]
MAALSTVAVLGTGIMGAPMARNLRAAGLDVRAWNRTPDKARPLSDSGVDVTDRPADAVAGADAVVTMLADGSAVEEVMSEQGALAAMDDEAVWIQASTVGVDALARLSELAARRGVGFVDAPVLGTRQPAEAGELVVLAAGDERLRDRCKPVLDAIGSRTRWLDGVGAATRFKLVLNGWIVGLVETLAETIGLARAMDIEPGAFLAAIEGGPLDCAYAQAKGAAMAEEAFEPPSFPLRLAAKDARLVLEAARGAGLSLPLMRATCTQFERSIGQGHGDEDMAAAYWSSRPVAGSTTV